MDPTFDICKFCYSNGEAETQYRSHRLKNSSGLVTCPVLGSFICPICKATGDFAHTQRYCPLNMDGQFNSGASLTELKKKKNAAGNFPSSKKNVWPIPSSHYKVFSSYTSTNKSLWSPPAATKSFWSPPAVNKSFWSPPTAKKADSLPYYKVAADSLLPVTDPLPSCYRPPSPPTVQHPPAQLTVDRHLEYFNFYQNKQLQHQVEIAKLQAIREAARVTFPPCYMRNFPSPMSVTPPGSPKDKFVFPDPEKKGFDHGRDLLGRQVGKGQGVLMAEDKGVEKMDAPNDVLGNLLAELREGTEEVDM